MKAAARATNKQGEGVLKNFSAQKGRESVLPKEYQAIFKNTGKPMVIVEEDAAISLANTEFEKLSGYTKEEIEGKKSWTEFVARGDRRRVKEYHHLRRSDPMLAPRCFEFRFLDRHGKAKDIVLTIGTIPGTKKSMASLLDVTDRRRAEASLRASEVRYHTLFENSREAFYITTSNGAYIDANQAALDLFGYTRKEMKKVNARQLYADPADARKFQKEIEKKGSVRDFEVKLRKKDGTEMDCLFTVTAQRIDDGGILEYQGIIRDITERKQMEKKLQQNEERYRTLVEKVDFGVNLIDTEYNIVMANAEQSKRMHKPVSELIGKKCFREFEKRDAVCPNCPGVQTLASGQPAETEAEAVRDDGSRFHVRLQTFPIFGQDGTASGFIEVIEDITERKRAEKKIERLAFFPKLNPMPIVELTQKGYFTYANPAAQHLFPDLGTRQDEHPFLVGLKPYFARLRKKKETYVLREVEAGGGWYSQVIVLVDPEHIRIYSTDITERKKYEETLKQSEERYRALVENIKLGINLIDTDYNIIMVNTPLSKRVTKPVSDLIGKKCFREFQKRDAVCPDCPGVQAIVTGKPAEVEIEGVRDDGGRFHLMLRAFPILGQDGKVTAFTEVVEDITERIQIQEALRETEERFRMLAENMPFGISVMAPDRSFEYFNPQFTEIFGYTIEDIPDKDTWFEKAYPDEAYRKKVASLWKNDVKGDVKIGEENPRVFTVQCKDGQDKIIDFRTVYLKDGKQYLVYEDINDRAKAEEALKQSEERYRALVENVNLGINLINADHTILSVNAGQSGHFNKPRSETIGKKCYQEFEKRDAVCPHCPGVQTMATGQPAETEAEAVRDDGSRFHVRLQTFPIFGQDGTVTSFIEVVEDITERKRMEKELQQTEDRFRRVVETMKVGLTSVDEKGVLVYANEQFCKMLGYSINEVIGHPTVDFYYDEEARKNQKEIFAKRKKGMRDPSPYEVTWKTKDGRKVQTILSPTPHFDADGHYKGSFAIQTDITERKRMEERLKRYAAELEQSNEEVKNFAYIVSHDLRVPLVNLKGYTSELHSALEVIGPTMETALPHLNEDKRSAVAIALHEDVPEALEFITNSVSRMDSFINSVLILSRLGRRELKPEPIDMNALVQTSLENLSHQIQERGTTVTIESLPQVVADRTAIEQIMGNILGNAVKYLDPERPGQINVTAQTNNGEQIFRISDNGRGIAEEDMHKVFAPFRRAGKQDTPGEGMGLAYVKTLVRRHNGRIWCESEIGKGTTFTFTISNHVTERGEHVSG